MARHAYCGTFKDGNGRVVGTATTANATVGTISIYLANGTTAADVYAAESGGTAVNSVSTDDNGYFKFWVDDSEYMPSQRFKITLSHADFEDKSYDDLKIIPYGHPPPSGTLADDATPSVANGFVWLTGGTTTITDFDDGETYQIIYVIAEHSVTLTDGTNIFLNGSVDYDMSAKDVVMLVCKADNKWYEIGRGGASGVGYGGGPLTIGDTTYDDGTITDATGLEILTDINYLTIGDGTTYEGHVHILGNDTGSGGHLRIYAADFYDTNNEYFWLGFNQDAFVIAKEDGSQQLLIYNENTDIWEVPATSEFNFKGPVTMGDAVKQQFDFAPASDNTGSGISILATVDANATGIGALLVLSSDGNWDEADADAEATVGQLALAIESGTGTKQVLLYGAHRNDAWNWTPGAQLFVSTTTGAITATQPSGSGDFVQVVGWALTADIILFSPSPDYVELVA